jgi:diguanylate cyclase (GGDEF)-like protein
MAKKTRKSSLASYNLKRKLTIAFTLMSILPILICGYIVSWYILPKMGLRLDIAATLIVSVIISVAGFALVKEIFDRIVLVSTAAKLIAAGDMSHLVEIEQRDEIGDLGGSLNQLTQRIRANMDELKSYSEKTTEINVEIQKRVMVLSSLLQLSSLVSQGVKLEEILRVAVEKARLLASSDVAYLLFRDSEQDVFYTKMADGINSGYLLKLSVEPKSELFNKPITENKPLIIDKQSLVSEGASAAFYDKFRIKNTLAIPVYLRGTVRAILGVGNARESFLYKKDDIELIEIFAKQIAIAIENDILMRRVEKLEIKDALTGLFNEVFIRSRLQEEIKRAVAYRRPCAFILFDIDDFKQRVQNHGSLYAESALKKLSAIIKDSVTEIDSVARTGDDEFAILLPEKNKRQAQEIAEEIRKKVEFSYSEESDPDRKISLSAGVSENPLDGVDAETLIKTARELVAIAKKQGKNKTVAFKEPTAR